MKSIHEPGRNKTRKTRNKKKISLSTSDEDFVKPKTVLSYSLFYHDPLTPRTISQLILPTTPPPSPKTQILLLQLFDQITTRLIKMRILGAKVHHACADCAKEGISSSGGSSSGRAASPTLHFDGVFGSASVAAGCSRCGFRCFTDASGGRRSASLLFGAAREAGSATEEAWGMRCCGRREVGGCRDGGDIIVKGSGRRGDMGEDGG